MPSKIACRYIGLSMLINIKNIKKVQKMGPHPTVWCLDKKRKRYLAMFCFHGKVLWEQKEKTTAYSWKENKNQFFWHIVKGCTAGRTVKNSVLSKNPSAGVCYGTPSKLTCKKNAHTLPQDSGWNGMRQWEKTLQFPEILKRIAWEANQSGKGCTEEEMWSDDYMNWACLSTNHNSTAS